MIVICFALAVAGGYFATQNCATYSLFADSIPQGHRAKWLTRASVVNQLASGLGPFIGLFLFVYFGNEWRLSVLHTVLIIGFLGFIPANFFLFGWTDVTHEDGLGGNAGRSGECRDLLLSQIVFQGRMYIVRPHQSGPGQYRI